MVEKKCDGFTSKNTKRSTTSLVRNVCSRGDKDLKRNGKRKIGRSGLFKNSRSREWKKIKLGSVRTSHHLQQQSSRL